MKTATNTKEEKKRRGAPLKGDKLRRRYNVTLDPDIVGRAKKRATSTNVSFSELLEDGLRALGI